MANKFKQDLLISVKPEGLKETFGDIKELVDSVTVETEKSSSKLNNYLLQNAGKYTASLENSIKEIANLYEKSIDNDLSLEEQIDFKAYYTHIEKLIKKDEKTKKEVFKSLNKLTSGDIRELGDFSILFQDFKIPKNISDSILQIFTTPIKDSKNALNDLSKDYKDFFSSNDKKHLTRFWDDLVNKINSGDEELKELLNTLGLIDKASNKLNLIHQGGNNYGGIIGEDNVLISRRSRNTSIKDAELLKEKLDEAAKSGINVSRILDVIYQNKNDEFYLERQEKAKGNILGDIYGLYGAENEYINPDFFKATDEQIEKLLKDLYELNKLGIGLDLNTTNILYDKEKGFSLIDLDLNPDSDIKNFQSQLDVFRDGLIDAIRYWYEDTGNEIDNINKINDFDNRIINIGNSLVEKYDTPNVKKNKSSNTKEDIKAQEDLNKEIEKTNALKEESKEKNSEEKAEIEKVTEAQKEQKEAIEDTIDAKKDLVDIGKNETQPVDKVTEKIKEQGEESEKTADKIIESENKKQEAIKETVEDLKKEKQTQEEVNSSSTSTDKIVEEQKQVQSNIKETISDYDELIQESREYLEAVTKVSGKKMLDLTGQFGRNVLSDNLEDRFNRMVKIISEISNGKEITDKSDLDTLSKKLAAKIDKINKAAEKGIAESSDTIKSKLEAEANALDKSTNKIDKNTNSKRKNNAAIEAEKAARREEQESIKNTALALLELENAEENTNNNQNIKNKSNAQKEYQQNIEKVNDSLKEQNNINISSEYNDLSKINSLLDELKLLIKDKNDLFSAEQKIVNTLSISESEDLKKIEDAIVNICTEIMRKNDLFTEEGRVVVEAVNTEINALKELDAEISIIQGRLETINSSPIHFETSNQKVNIDIDVNSLQEQIDKIDKLVQQIKLSFDTINNIKINATGLEKIINLLKNKSVQNINDVKLNGSLGNNLSKVVEATKGVKTTNLESLLKFLQGLARVHFDNIGANLKELGTGIGKFVSEMSGASTISELNQVLENIKLIQKEVNNIQKQNKGKGKDNNTSTVSPEDTATINDYINALKKRNSLEEKYQKNKAGLANMTAKETSEYNQALKTINSIDQKTESIIAGNTAWNNQVNDLKNSYKEISQIAAQNIQDTINTKTNEGYINQLEKAKTAVSKISGSRYLEEDINNAKQYIENLESVINRLKANKTQFVDESQVALFQELSNNAIEFANNLKEVNNKAANLKSTKSYITNTNQALRDNGAWSKEARDRIKELVRQMEQLSDAGKLTTGQLNQLRNSIEGIKAAEFAAGRGGRTLFQNWGSQLVHLNAQFLAMHTSLMDIIRYTRELAQNTINVDTALTELRKVSDASNDRIQQSFEKSAETAKELGSSISEVISATADWSRAGFSVDQAEELARVSTLYQNVGDNLDAATANEYLVSTLRGFQMDASEAEGIVDRLNEVARILAIQYSNIL